MHFIYRVENKVNGKLYIGQTICPNNRRKQHFSKTFHGNPALDRAVLKYGRENFDFSIIEELETLKEANLQEHYWVSKLGTLVPSGYNLKEGGDAGGPDSPQTKEKKRQSKLGQRNHFYGKEHSDESKQKISLAKIGVSIQLSNEDRKRRKDQMIRMNKSRIGKNLSLEQRQKISMSVRGRTHSEKTKRKMSGARRMWWAQKIQLAK